MKYDIFLSYATEEKEIIARGLSNELGKKYKVWFDEGRIDVGDSIKKTIDDGIINSDFGVMIISKSYLKKPWTNYELNWFVAKESLGRNDYIIPIWHDIKPDHIDSTIEAINEGKEDNIAKMPKVVIEVLKGLVSRSDVTTNDFSTMIEKIKSIVEKQNTKVAHLSEKEELEMLKDAYTIDLYNEWHLPKFKKSIKYVTDWITENDKKNIPMMSLSSIEDEGAHLEYHVFEIIHFYEKWAFLSKSNIVDKQQIFKLLGVYSNYFEDNLIRPLLSTKEKNSDFNNLLNFIKIQLLDK